MADDPKDKSPDVATLQAEADKYRTQMQTWMAKATDYEKRYKDVDPEEYFANKQALRDLQKKSAQTGDPKDIEQLENALKADYEKRYGNKITELESNFNKVNGELKELRVTSVVMQEAAKWFNADSLPLLQHEIKSGTAFKDGGIIIADEKGQARYSKKDPRRAMDITEYMEELKEKYPSLAKPSVISGGQSGGARTQSNGGGFYISAQEYKKLPNTEQRQLSKQIQTMAPDARSRFLKELIS